MSFLRSIPILLIASSSSNHALSRDFTLNGFASLTGGMTLGNLRISPSHEIMTF